MKWKRFINFNMELEDCGIWFYLEPEETLVGKQLSERYKEPHAHPWYELQFVLEGRIRYEIKNSERREAEADQVFLIPPAIYHFTLGSSEAQAKRYVINFELYKIEGVKGELYNALCFLFNTQKPVVLKSKETVLIVKEVLKYLKEETLGRNILLKNALTRLIFAIVKEFPREIITKTDKSIKSDSTDFSYIRLGILLANLSDDSTLKGLSKELYLGEKQINTIVKARYGMTFKQKHTADRFEKVKHRLTETDKSVEEIAEEVGFTNLTYFYKKFREYTGLTPFQYRKKHKLGENK